jgi:hypothetical protein
LFECLTQEQNPAPWELSHSPNHHNNQHNHMPFLQQDTIVGLAHKMQHSII